LGQLVVIDAIDDGEVGAVGRRRDQDAFGASGHERGGLVARGEDAGALHRDVHAEILIRQLGRILDRGHLDLVTPDMDRVALDRDLMRKAPVHAVEAQQMRVGFDRTEIVDRDNLDVLPARLDDRAQYEPPDASEAIDRYSGDHRYPLLMPARDSRPSPDRSVN